MLFPHECRYHSLFFFFLLTLQTLLSSLPNEILEGGGGVVDGRKRCQSCVETIVCRVLITSCLIQIRTPKNMTNFLQLSYSPNTGGLPLTSLDTKGTLILDIGSLSASEPKIGLAMFVLHRIPVHPGSNNGECIGR